MSSMLTGFPSGGRCLQVVRGNGRQWSHLALDPACHNTKLPCPMCPLVPQWQECYGVTNSFLLGQRPR